MEDPGDSVVESWFPSVSVKKSKLIDNRNGIVRKKMQTIQTKLEQNHKEAKKNDVDDFDREKSKKCNKDDETKSEYGIDGEKSKKHKKDGKIKCEAGIDGEKSKKRNKEDEIRSDSGIDGEKSKKHNEDDKIKCEDGIGGEKSKKHKKDEEIKSEGGIDGEKSKKRNKDDEGRSEDGIYGEKSKKRNKDDEITSEYDIDREKLKKHERDYYGSKSEADIDRKKSKKHKKHDKLKSEADINGEKSKKRKRDDEIKSEAGIEGKNSKKRKKHAEVKSDAGAGSKTAVETRGLANTIPKVKHDKTKVKTKHMKEEKKEIDSAFRQDTAKRKRGQPSAAAEEKQKKKEEEEKNKWKWWEEKKLEDGVKWKFLEHSGPTFAPEYEPLPESVKFYFDGNAMKLSRKAEEVAGFYGKMLDHEYTTKKSFRNNFFDDWRKQMNKEERSILTDLDLCNFKEIFEHYKALNEAKKALSKEEKKKLKEDAEVVRGTYGFCMMDGHKETIGNWKVEPPGLFRGRGNHPKQGMLKLRIQPEDVIINCSSNSKIPEPPAGHKWKEVRHDNKVTWLASWTENVQGQVKYVMLNASSKLKGEKDWQKYEVARRLKDCVEDIRNQYQKDLKSREMRIRQRAVALYFIDKLALRAGNEKEEGETADTVGCCSLRVEHITLHTILDKQKYMVEFDFLGKDSIRYYNNVPVDKQVFKNLGRFMDGKQPDDDLFDRLNTGMVNKHLQELMDGLTAKVFRTYNASTTLQQQLKELTNPSEGIAEKILSYNRANRAVALLCNHQRTPPKSFDQSMANLQTKIDNKKAQLQDAVQELQSAQCDLRHNDVKNRKAVESKQKAVERLEEQLLKLEVQATDREENKQISLGTSKLNYLDPRITVAWCKKWGVPIEKIYNKTQRDKFAWAIAMTEEDFEF
uniref:DNA topoisomerase I, mitochondrial-like n=1 Tax=Myxine glutinosa TaxID=7769 RepID=UPI00358FEAEB